MKSVQHAIRNRLSKHRHDSDNRHGDDFSNLSYSTGLSYETEQGAAIQNPHNFEVVEDQHHFGEHVMSLPSTAESFSGPGAETIIDGNHSRSGRQSPDLGEDNEKAVYELQLTQLQEQLVAVMIENQSLKNEVKEHKQTSKVDSLKEELGQEKKKSQLLQKQLHELEKKQRRSQSEESVSSDVHVSSSGVELAEMAADHLDSGGDGGGGSDGRPPARPPGPPVKKSMFTRLWEWIVGGVYDIMEDMEPMETLTEEDEDGDTLAVKKLKENIKRFKTALKPYINTFKGIHSLITWKSPSFTLLAFALYMYTIYMGYFLPFTLFLLTFRLFINYLKYRGVNINFNYLDPGEEEKESEDKDLGVHDKFNLVLHVARKVQNILGGLADSLEKIKNLLIWKAPYATRHLFLGLFFGFVASCIFTPSFLFYFGGLYMGVKFFVIDYFHNRYPRLKMKYDTVYKIWLTLPTDAVVEKQNIRSEIDKYILPQQQSDSDPETWSETQIDHMSRDDKSFCELFSLPLSECPLPGWQGGKRCTLINKDKTLTSAFKNGKLFLTRSFLCFERSKTPSPKNIVIPLSDIAKIEKAKPYSWMPGGGMAIEIVLTGSDKTFVFGALLNRDDGYDNIVCAGRRAQLPWANDPEVVMRRHSFGFEN